jgi:PPOX class probable F420-dependent enzyme
VCHVVVAGAPPVLYTPIDEKPKAAGDPLGLARVRDIAARPAVVVLVDRWEEEWSALGWLRVEGRATTLAPAAPEHAVAVDALRGKYPQYLGHRLEERPIIRVALGRSRSWGRLDWDA